MTTSRYFGRYYNTSDNEARLVAERYATRSSPYFTHVVKERESFASLAFRYLNDERLYWYIADQNPQIKFADYLPVGALVRIPLQ